jgi:hypothetical protein
MNPGVGEEVGKVASGAIDALKNQPLILALVLMQLLTIGAILYNAIHRQNAVDKQFAQVFALLQTCLKQAAPASFNLPLREDEAVPIDLPLPRPRPNSISQDP